MKTIGFAGCSFTYGDGLDYYFGSRETSRFSHLVASHFNVQSLNQSFRGGSHTQIISWWDSFLEHQSIDAFVFQFTMWTRSDSFILPNVSHIDMFSKHEKVFRQWSIENNIRNIGSEQQYPPKIFTSFITETTTTFLGKTVRYETTYVIRSYKYGCCPNLDHCS